MSKSVKQQFNSTVTIKDNELSGWLRVLLFLCNPDSGHREYYYMMIKQIRYLNQQCGNAWLAKYLKECNRLVMVWVSKDDESRKATVLSEGIPVGISRGLPRIIPPKLRLLIEAGDNKSLKIVLSVLNLYRVWPCDPVLKLETITKPFQGLSETLPITEIKEIIKLLPFVGKPTAAVGLNITTAGPNFKISSLSAPFDAFTFATKPELLASLEAYARATGSLDFFRDFEEECARVQTHVKNEFKLWISKKPLMLGKLSKKFEAAGKVRIFAITDWWTQCFFKPLHIWINDGLSKIKQDGTFDQLAPLRHLTGSFRVSYDLSAATDRLPVALQVQILGLILNQEAAIAWRDLLVKRDWFLKEDDKWVPYRYAVGQPMGAYSSFPMLALTHHVIVQIAARRAGYLGWFTNYALLGDDIVIADPNVAPHYLLIMRDILGVEINLSKSLWSVTGAMEFAKRLFKEGKDLSPLSPKVVLLALRNVFYLPDLIQDMVAKEYVVDTKSLLALGRSSRGPFKGVSKNNVFKAVWSCFAPFGVLQVYPIQFLDIGMKREELLFNVRDFSLRFCHNSWTSAYDRSNKAKDAWQDAREAERGGLPGDVIIDLPSTRLVDSKILGVHLNQFDPQFSIKINLFRGHVDPMAHWFYISDWIRGMLESLSEPAYSVSDFLSPKEQNKSTGIKAWNFWSMVRGTLKLPKMPRFSYRRKKDSSSSKKNKNNKR